MEKKTADLMRKIFKSLAPPKDITLSEWADTYRVLSSESSAEPGKWRTNRAPYQRGIMDAITDISVKKVVVMSASQIGKTDMAILNPLGYYIHYDPAPILVMYPTVSLCEMFSKERLSPMIRDCKVLSERISDTSRTSGNTIMLKKFPGGQVAMVGANAPAGLSARPVRMLFADEIDRYPLTAGNEGDPLLLAEKRQTAYWNKKTVVVSSPTIKGDSRIETEYEHSSKEHWYVPCPACGAGQKLCWSNIIFDRDDLEVIKMVCDKCGTLSTEAEWKMASANGYWQAEDPENKVRGFHINSLASPFTSWREVVEKFLEANEAAKNGNPELLKVWTNTEMGETWEEEGESLEGNDIAERREDYGCEVPSGVICLTAGIDTQDDRFEFEVVGWGKGKENWGIQYGVIRGDLKTEEPWKELDELLNREFLREDGVKLRIACTCFDSGGHFTTEVYRFCKERYAQRVYAIKGKGGAEVAYINKPTRNNRVGAMLFTIGVDTGKSILYQRLKVEDEGANYCHFPEDPSKGYDEAYFEGLTSEILVLTYRKGRAVYVWKKKSTHARNEPHDCRNYATAAVEILNPRLEEESAPEATPRRGRRRRN